MDEEDVGFTTASDLREEASVSADTEFSVDHPERTHQRSGGMRYEGGTVFVLAADGDLAAAVEAILAEGPYRYGDWFDLPMPLYLVHDDDTGDTFRVAVRDGTVELHPRSATGPEGLRAFYERLADRVGHVEMERKR